MRNRGSLRGLPGWMGFGHVGRMGCRRGNRLGEAWDASQKNSGHKHQGSIEREGNGLRLRQCASMHGNRLNYPGCVRGDGYITLLH